MSRQSEAASSTDSRSDASIVMPSGGDVAPSASLSAQVAASCQCSGAFSGRQLRATSGCSCVCQAAATSRPSSRPATTACRPVAVSRQGTTREPTRARTRTNPAGGSSLTRTAAASPTSRTGSRTWLRAEPAGSSSSTSRGDAHQASPPGVSPVWPEAAANLEPISASIRGPLSTGSSSITRSPSRIASRSPGRPTTRLIAMPSVAWTTQRSNLCGRRQRSSTGSQPVRTTSPASSPGAIDVPSTTYHSGRVTNTAGNAARKTATFNADRFRTNPPGRWLFMGEATGSAAGYATFTH